MNSSLRLMGGTTSVVHTSFNRGNDKIHTTISRRNIENNQTTKVVSPEMHRSPTGELAKILAPLGGGDDKIGYPFKMAKNQKGELTRGFGGYRQLRLLPGRLPTVSGARVSCARHLQHSPKTPSP